ncbi:MAG: PKD domain-containing protein, partial [Bacteroidia bacterium]|nr:PKD domain-containing protein [Bacteroidia bacterium]
MRPYKPLIILSFLFVISSCKEDEEPLSTNIDAAFSSDITEVKEGNEVSFTDQSIGDPTTWTWTFEGGTPATSSEQNPTVSYNKTGTYSVSLIASNATYTDSIFKEKLISVTCDERYCTPQFTAYTKTNRISYGVDQNQHEM